MVGAEKVQKFFDGHVCKKKPAPPLGLLLQSCLWPAMQTYTSFCCSQCSCSWSTKNNLWNLRCTGGCDFDLCQSCTKNKFGRSVAREFTGLDIDSDSSGEEWKKEKEEEEEEVEEGEDEGGEGQGK